MLRQLRMLWPITERPPNINFPNGYVIRSFRESDAEDYIAVLNNRDLGHWTIEQQSKFADDFGEKVIDTKGETDE